MYMVGYRLPMEFAHRVDVFVCTKSACNPIKVK